MALVLDTKNEGYKKYVTDGVIAQEDIIKSEVNKIVAGHTIDELRENQAAVQDEILSRLRRLYESDFIVSVAFPTYTYEESN